MQHSNVEPPSAVCRVNVFSAESTLLTLRPVSLECNRHVVNEIIDDIFDERKGTCDVSSSQCSSIKMKPSEYSFDKRLKYWKDVLKDRQKLEKKIIKKTAKKPEGILYNRLATIDERDKQTVKTVLDYAARLNPTNLSVKKRMVLPGKCDQTTGRPLVELQETWPLAERNKFKSFEICGLPMAIRMEMLGKPKKHGVDKPYGWLSSKFLQHRIVEKLDDIERIVEFYPDVENLEVVGDGLCKTEPAEHDSDIKLLKRDQCFELSSESQDTGNQNLLDASLEGPKSIMYGLRLNDQVYQIDKKHDPTPMTIDLIFYNHPYGREVKKLLTVQNIGKKILSFEWSHLPYYPKSGSLLKSTDNEFLFDNTSFRLFKEQTKEIFVHYQPRKVDIVKSKWILKVFPCCSCEKRDGIVIRFNGHCVPYPEYINKLNDIQTEVIEKSNLKMIRKLTTGLGTISAQMKPLEVICPYQRTLNDVELFEQLNHGYKCERIHDLELLKDLYRRVKKPRDKQWDLKVDCLKSTVLRVQDPEARALYFNELNGILDSMKGQAMELEERLISNPEREKASFLYVRGIICSSIDEWEELSVSLEETFLKSNLKIVKDELTEMKLNANEDESPEGNLFNMLEDESALGLYVLEKRVKTLKSFRDCLYMQTYTLVCDFIENIVNIIEGTKVI